MVAAAFSVTVVTAFAVAVAFTVVAAFAVSMTFAVAAAFAVAVMSVLAAATAVAVAAFLLGEEFAVQAFGKLLLRGVAHGDDLSREMQGLSYP